MESSGINHIGSPIWSIVLCVFLTWFIIFLFQIHGIQTLRRVSIFPYFLFSWGKADCGRFWLCSVYENKIPFIIAHAKIWIVDVNLLIFILNSHRGCPVRSCIVEVKLCSQHLRSLRQFTFLLCKFQNACHKTQVTNVLSE